MASAPPTNIKFQDEIRKVTSDTTTADERIALGGAIASGSSAAGGIYHARSRSRVPTDRRRSFSRRPSADRRADNLDVEEGDDWQRDDFRRKQVFRGKTLFWLDLPFQDEVDPLADISKAVIPIHWRHIWRCRNKVNMIWLEASLSDTLRPPADSSSDNQSPLRVFVDIHGGAYPNGCHRGSVHYHLGLDAHGDGQVRLHHPPCR